MNKDELINEIIKDSINENGFNKFIDNIIKHNEDCEKIIFHRGTIMLLNDSREIVIERNKPEEISYFNELLREHSFKLMELIHIEEKTA